MLLWMLLLWIAFWAFAIACEEGWLPSLQEPPAVSAAGYTKLQARQFCSDDLFERDEATGRKPYGSAAAREETMRLLRKCHAELGWPLR